MFLPPRFPLQVGRTLVLSFHLMCAVGFFAHWAAAAPGSVEADFAPGIYHEQLVHKALPLPDGRVLLLGRFTTVSGTPQPYLARLNPDGTLDHSFRPVLDGQVSATVILPDGKFVIAGAFSTVGGVARQRLARLNPDGTLDEGFDAAADAHVAGLVLQAGGKILVAGSFTHINGSDHAYLARLNADGSVDETFSVAVDALVKGITPHPDGGFYVMGSFTSVQGAPRSYVARLMADGSLDAFFAPAVNGFVEAVAVQPDGATLLAGRFTTVDNVTRQRIARIRADGVLDPQFTPPTVNNDIYSLALQANGRILICGAFSFVSSQQRRGVARLLATGGLDSSFISNWQSSLYISIVLQDNGRVLMAGGQSPSQYSAPTNAARLFNDGAPQSLAPTSDFRVQWLRGGAAPEVLNAAFDLSTDGGNSWTPLGIGTRISGGWELTGLNLPPSGTLRARARLGSGDGSSTVLEMLSPYGLAAPIPQPEIAIEAPDGAGLTAGSGSVRLAANRAPQIFTIRNLGATPLQITGITIPNGTLDLSPFPNSAPEFQLDFSGMLTRIPAGAQTTFAVTLDPLVSGDRTVKMTVVSNDTAENPFDITLIGPGAVSSRIDVMAMFATTPSWIPPQEYLLKPPFTPTVTGYTVTIPNNLASAELRIGYDPMLPFEARPSATIDGVPINSSGALLTLGRAASRNYAIEFTAPDGVTTRTYDLHVNRSPPLPGDLDLTLDLELPASGLGLRTSVLHPEGGTLLGGWFGDIHGVPLRGLARLGADGTVDPAFAPQIQGAVSGTAVRPDGQIYIFGSFSSVNGQSRRYLARLFADGTLDKSFRPAITFAFHPDLACLAVQDDGRILIGGDFSTVNEAPVKGLARLNADGSLDTTFKGQSNAAVSCLALQPDGKILVGGSFTQLSSSNAKWLARLNPDGSLDSTFTAPESLTENVISLALQPDGNMLINGVFSSYPGGPGASLFTRLLPNGAIDSFQSSSQFLSSYSLRADGKIVISQPITGISRLQSGGPIDNGFNSNRLNYNPASFFDSVMIAEDGSLHVLGRFENWTGFAVPGHVRLHGDAAAPPVAPPTIVPPNELRWQQDSGGGPVAERVLFQLSSDGGATWQALGYGRYGAGIWSLQGLDLPGAGRVRALAFVRSGYLNASQGLLASPAADLALTPPQIAVEQPEGTPLASGAGVTGFGSVGVKASASITFTVLNEGQTYLWLGNPTITGPHAAMFVISAAPSAAVASATIFTVRFTPASAGVKTAVLHLPCNDGNTPVFDILLTGTGVAALPPLVKTLSAEVTGPTTVILRGSIDPRGSDRLAIFDWGTTTKYGMSFGSADGVPAAVSGNGIIPFQAVLTGLQPHTKYHFRLHAASAEGAATGAGATFTTLNSPPVAGSDAFTFIRGTTATIPLLGNDSDPDGDSLRLLSISSPPSSSQVRVVKSGDRATVTFGAAAPPSVSFTYKISDGFGGTAVGDVTLTAGAGSVQPSFLNFTAEPQSKWATVTVSSGARWMAKPSAAWVKCSPGNGSSSSGLQVSVLANTAKAARTANIDLGGGVRLSISQQGVILPELTQPDFIPEGIISGYYWLAIPTKSRPVTYTVTGLPPGLRIDPATGFISGWPTKAGSYLVTVKARNAAGTATNAPQFTIVVSPLPEGAVGTYHGFIGSPTTGESGQFQRARFQMTTTATGAVSGKIFTGATSRSFKGKVHASGSSPNTPTVIIDVTYPPKEITSISLTLDAAANAASGTWNGAPITAWRQVWRAVTNPATTYQGLHSLYFRPPNDFTGLPQGHGFATFAVDEKTGTYNLAGKLATGSAILTSSFIGPAGQMLVYQSLYKDEGSFGGVLTVASDHRIGGTATWYKPAVSAASNDSLYPDGFTPATYPAAGNSLPAVAPGGVLCGLANEDDNASLLFGLGGLELEGREFQIRFSLRNPNGTGLTNVATFPDSNPNSVVLTAINLGTGAFSGEFTLPAADGLPARKAAFYGQTVQVGANVNGYGYFLLPQPADNDALAPAWSGTILLRRN